MPTSNSEIKVDSAEPLSVVEITDGRYRLIKQAPRTVSERLPPGLYVTRVKYDDRVEERLVEHGTKPTHIRFGLDDSFKTGARRERESAEFYRHANAVRSIGMSTWITVSIKAPGLGELQRSDNLQLPSWSEFSVCTLDGHRVAQPSDDFLAADSPGAGRERILSHGMDVGWYSLRIPSRDGAWAYLPLYVSRRFSPTVLLEVGGVNDGRVWFDFDRLVVSYDELEGAAYGDPARLAALRAARRSLQLGRNGLTNELMQVLLEQKFQDPMLGLLALQLLLLSAKPRLGAEAPQVRQFNTVMSNMAGALELPQHPDLVLARAQARRLKWPVKDMPGDEEPLVAPPLLRANWNALVATSSRRRELVGTGRLLRRVSEGLLQTGIWVMWKPPAHRRDQDGIVEVREVSHVQEQLTSAVSDAVLLEPRIPKYANMGRPERRVRSPVDAFSAPRPSRAIDAQLEEIVDHVRGQDWLRKALQERLQADPPTSTVLERAVCRAALQLADVETLSERNVPVGFAKRLAEDLAVPFALVGETVKRMLKELKSWSPYADARSTLERSFLP